MTSTEKTRKSVKDEIKAGKRPKKKKRSADTAVKKNTAANAVVDQSKSLPQEHQASRIAAKQVSSNVTVNVDIKDIKSTSQTVYVNDIHTANPEKLATVYWIIMPNTAHVVLRVTEEQYNEILSSKDSGRINHLYSVIDMGVFPSLTYGSWSLNKIKDFPTPQQIAAYDAHLSTLQVSKHNQPYVLGDIIDEEEAGEDFFDFGDAGDEDVFDFGSDEDEE